MMVSARELEESFQRVNDDQLNRLIIDSKVNHPLHYGGDSQYEAIKVLENWLQPDEFIGFLKGNSLKYLARHRYKGGNEDLRKSQWYQNRLNEYREKTKKETKDV